MFEVVVRPSLFIEDVHDDVAVVHRHPLAPTQALDAHWARSGVASDHSLDLLDDGAHLTIIATRRDDEHVKGVHQSAQVEHDHIQGELLLGPVTGRIHEGGNEVVQWAATRVAGARDLAQWVTPRTMTVATKGAPTATTPATIQR